MALKIASRGKSFLIGLAIPGKGKKPKFVKVFDHNDKNDQKVRDFLRILVEASLYTQANQVIRVSPKQMQALEDDFRDHPGTLKFMKAAQKKNCGWVVIMHQRRIPINSMQAGMMEKWLRN